jgi:hypothetical protein
MLAYIAQSAITLINISAKLPSSISECQIRRIVKSTDLLRRIGEEVTIPLFSISSCERLAQGDRLGQEISGDPLTIFSGSGLHPALSRPACRHLFLGGLWLDEDVLIAAIAAQNEGFDTRILIDFSVARDEFFRSLTIARLNQHGILLTTTRQTLFEWALTAGDPNLRNTLKALLHNHNP